MSENILPFDPLTISALQATMVAALAKYGDQTPMSANVNTERKLAIVMSEMGEVADAVLENHHNKDLITELLQTSAMALAWAQYLDVGQADQPRHAKVTDMPRLY